MPFAPEAGILGTLLFQLSKLGSRGCLFNHGIKMGL